MKKLWAWALRKLQSRCEHPPGSVTADILEGDLPDHGVHWCRLCGAYRRTHEYYGPPEARVEFVAWTEPRPDWWAE